jgi:hypothetical protein
LVVAVVFHLCPAFAAAADVPVSYTVDEKPLKAASAGTSLAFEVYGNATCTTLVHTAAVPIEDVSLLVRLKQLTPKNDAKLPNTVELRATLPGVPVPGPYYLKVTDVGGTIVPVGSSCQAQAAGAGGPAILPRTVLVSADGTPAQNGAALLAAASAITGDVDRPTTLQLDDGEYHIGSTTLALTGIVLAGRSAEHTLITAGGHAALSDTTGGAVRTDSNVRDLSIAVNGGGSTYGAGIVFVGFGTITSTNVTVTNAANSYGVWNVFGELTLRNAKVNTDGSGPSVGVRNDWVAFGAQTRVLDSNVIASSSNVGDGDALVSDGGIVRASGGTLEGAGTYARANPGASSFRIRLAGVSGATAGTVSCVGTTTASNTFSNTCPAEFWSTSWD